MPPKRTTAAKAALANKSSKTPSSKTSAPPSKTPTSNTNATDFATRRTQKGTSRTISSAKAAEPTNIGGKRKKSSDDVPQGDDESLASGDGVRAKRAKRPTTPIIPKKFPKVGKKLNEPPNAPLDVFVFGEGAGGELGLGSKTINDQPPIEVFRPRLNKLLSAKDAGVVQLACGGMHGVALTKDNKILTWGVNDHGALGRPTNVEEDDDDELNPAESTPAPLDTSNIDPDIKWVQVVGSDSASFALTDDGKVYGWGTFRGSDGILGFSENTKIQKEPVLIPDLKDIRQLAAGNNHVLALDGKGKVYAWGSNEKYQLGRRVPVGRPKLGLRPGGIGPLPVRGAKAVKVACGDYHSFAIDQEGHVFAWGLNNYAQLGMTDEAGEDDASQMKACLVENLENYRVLDVTGGQHHSLCVTDNGKLLTWGRIDGYQVGLRGNAFTEENTIFDEHGKPRILTQPLVVPDLPPIALVAAGTDHSIVLSSEGKAYSWGFSLSGRTGQGDEDDREVPTLINSKSVRDRKLTFADAGGPFSVLASDAIDLVNGSIA